MYKYLPLNKGFSTLVDEADFDWLNQWKWCFACGYARRARPKGEHGPKAIHMHREIMERKLGHPIPSNLQVDHINGNRLDNRRENLRLATNKQNTRNARKKSNNTSGYKGVHYFKQTERWQVYIMVDGKRRHLGYYEDVEIAARIYDAAARRFFKEFAKLNFPDDLPNLDIERLLEDALNYQPTSSYRGVAWREDRQCWRAYIRVGGKLKHLGSYQVEEEAARAYDRAALAFFGDDAVLNFPATLATHAAA